MYVQPGSVYAPQTYPFATHPGFIAPIAGGAQLAPQGFFGNLLGQLAGPAGQAIGGLFGQPQLGGQLGQFLGGLGSLLPFQAAPMLTPGAWQPTYPIGAQWAPQGVPVGILPPYLGSHLPLQPTPVMTPVPWQPTYPMGVQLAPQGFFGNLLGHLAGPVGQTIGGWFGQPQLGGQLGQVLGGLGSLLPFQAAPMLAQQWPYGGIVPPQLGSHLPFQPAPVMAPVA